MSIIISLVLNCICISYVVVSITYGETTGNFNQNYVIAATAMIPFLVAAMHIPQPRGIIKKAALNIAALAAVVLVGYMALQIGSPKTVNFMDFNKIYGAIISGMLIFFIFGETIARRLVPRLSRQ